MHVFIKGFECISFENMKKKWDSEYHWKYLKRKTFTILLMVGSTS